MKAKTIVIPTVFLLLVATAGILLAFQGWNARFIRFDMLAYVDDAQQFISFGRIPEKGTLTSFASYTPPGVTWLFVPGAYLFSDPRLFESFGSATLYLGTLVGIFLLARFYFGSQSAYVAVVLYALSELGLRFAESTSARGHPFFYVWMIYWLAKWVERRDSRYLAVAVVTIALGLYLHFEMAPALIILPAIWICYRPPLGIRWLLFAVVVIACIWYPYLDFEWSRGLVDLKSQLFLQTILPVDFSASWCNPDLLPVRWQTAFAAVFPESAPSVSPATTPRAGLLSWMYSLLARFYLIVADFLSANFHSTVPGAGRVLSGMSILGLLLLCIHGSNIQFDRHSNLQARSAAYWKWVGMGAVLCAVLFNELTIAFLSLDGVLHPSTLWTIRKFQALALLVGMAMVVWRERLAAAVVRMVTLPRLIPNASSSDKLTVLAISLTVPWVILLWITEGDRPRRFWWLWPVQVTILASVVTYFLSQLRLSRRWLWLGSSALLFVVITNPLLVSRLHAWVKDGWHGEDPVKIRVIDFVGRTIEREKRNRAAIGYSINIDPYMAAFNATDQRYKVGADFDLLFKYRHHIINTNQCAEGVSPHDEYRIVEANRTAVTGATAMIERIDIPLDSSLRILQTFDPYQVTEAEQVGREGHAPNLS